MSERALDRRAVAARLLRERGDALVVTGLGGPAYDVAAAGDSPLKGKAVVITGSFTDPRSGAKVSRPDVTRLLLNSAATTASSVSGGAANEGAEHSSNAARADREITVSC